MEKNSKKMTKKNITLCFVFLFILFIFSFLFIRNQFSHQDKNNMHPKTMHIIKQIKIISTDRYEVTFLSKGESVCIDGHLNYKIKSDSKNKIINLLNSIESPMLLIVDKNGFDYTIEIIFKQNGKDIKFSEWLKYNKLIYG
ncbi:MAG: hypothetical protein WCJ72_00935 [Chryseobacterium sp.]